MRFIPKYGSSTKPLQYDLSNLVEDVYYRINDTKKILLWNGDEFMKPEKDQQGRYGSWITRIDSQPKIKFVQEVDMNELYL